MSPAPSAGGAFVLAAILLLIEVFSTLMFWGLFQKAGHPGWTSLLPIYNLSILLQIANKPIWWAALAAIPLVNVVWVLLAIPVAIAIARRFDRRTGTTIGLVLLPFIFYPLLGFGTAEYRES